LTLFAGKATVHVKGFAMRLVSGLSPMLILAACASVPMGSEQADAISIVYRDSESNQRTLQGVIRYSGPVGGDDSVAFRVANLRGDHVCQGTLVKQAGNLGSFSISCLTGAAAFSAGGNYERGVGEPNGSFVGHGETSRGNPITLVVEREPRNRA
jgi:hypothetical protein